MRWNFENGGRRQPTTEKAASSSSLVDATISVLQIQARQRLLKFLMVPLVMESCFIASIIIISYIDRDLVNYSLQVLLVLSFTSFIAGIFLVVTSTARENASQAMLTYAGLFKMKTTEEVLERRRKDIKEEVSSWFASILVLGISTTLLILNGFLFVMMELTYLYLLLGVMILAVLLRKNAHLTQQVKILKGTTATEKKKFLNRNPHQPVSLDFDFIRGFKAALVGISFILLIYFIQIILIVSLSVQQPDLKFLPLLLDEDLLYESVQQNYSISFTQLILWVVLLFSLQSPTLIALIFIVSGITAAFLDRWMIVFKHSPDDSFLKKIPLMIPFTITWMLILSFLGLGIQVVVMERTNLLFLITILVNGIFGIVTSVIMAPIWWHHVMTRDFKDGIVIQREHLISSKKW